jgi:hypothetical protein
MGTVSSLRLTEEGIIEDGAQAAIMLGNAAQAMGLIRRFGRCLIVAS